MNKEEANKLTLDKIAEIDARAITYVYNEIKESVNKGHFSTKVLLLVHLFNHFDDVKLQNLVIELQNKNYIVNINNDYLNISWK